MRSFDHDNAGFEMGLTVYALPLVSLQFIPPPPLDRPRFIMAYPTSSIDQAIRTRLLSLQSSFFQSLQSGTDALAAFCQELTGFHEAVSSCEPNLQDETCRLIYSFAQTCTAVIPGLIDLNIASEKVIQEEGDEFYKLLDRMMLDDATCMGPFLFLL